VYNGEEFYNGEQWCSEENNGEEFYNDFEEF
jgi:hypothetical protein